MTLLSLTIDPATAEDAQRLAHALRQLTSEDSALSARTDGATGQVVIGCVSEQHLEIVVDRLKRDFDVCAAVGRPQVAYREALTRPAEGEAKCATQARGRGQYAHVKVRLHPALPGTGRIIENHVIGGAIPVRFIPAAEQGIRDGLDSGVLAGYPIHDVRIDLDDGSYHEVDSTDAAFRATASLAVREAARNADPVVLEPVMQVEVVVPPEYESDITTNLVSRRGRIQHREDRADARVVRALVPLAELFGYATDLAARTRGRGTSRVEFQEFLPVPAAEDDDDRASSVREPRRPAPGVRGSSVALPEPDAQAE